MDEPGDWSDIRALEKQTTAVLLERIAYHATHGEYEAANSLAQAYSILREARRSG